MSDAEQRIFAEEIAFLADHYCAVERRVEEWEAAIQRIEAHAPHVDTRVRDAWDTFADGGVS